MQPKYTTRGSALVIVLILLMVLIASAGILIQVSTARTVQTDNQRVLAQAKLLAETAISMKIHQMNTNDDKTTWVQPLAGTTGVGRWRVVATLESADPATGPYTIRGLGAIKVGENEIVSHGMEAKISKATVTTFTPGGAITFLGAQNGINANFSGNSFSITGNDTNLDDSAGSGDTTYGISTDDETATANLTTQVSN